MKFSIITVTYNAENYLEKTLRSVAEQSFTDFEHLLWDGGSHDRTLEIAASFGVRIFQGKDKGIADAMNKGAAAAVAEYLIHLHADDLLAHPHALAQIALALKQHPSFSWLYGRAHIIDERGEIIRSTPVEPFTRKRLKKYNFITHPATVISKELFEKGGGFDPSLKYCMDYDLWLRLSKITPPLYLPTPLACFREHAGSLSTSRPLAVAKEAYEVRNRYLRSKMEKWRSYRTYKKRCLVSI